MDPADFVVRLREGGQCFEFVHEPSGDVLLVTERVSLETLIRLYLEDEINAD